MQTSLTQRIFKEKGGEIYLAMSRYPGYFPTINFLYNFENGVYSVDFGVLRRDKSKTPLTRRRFKPLVHGHGVAQLTLVEHVDDTFYQHLLLTELQHVDVGLVRSLCKMCNDVLIGTPSCGPPIFEQFMNAVEVI